MCVWFSVEMELKIGKSHKLSAGETVFVNAPAPRDLADIQPER